MRRCLVIGLGLFLGLTAAWAGDGAATGPAPSTGPGPSTQPAGKLSVSQDHIAQLIDRLGSEKFAEREAAVKELIEIGQPALEALKSAVSDRNPERAERARNTLKAVEENLIPPEMYRAQIAAYIGPTSEAERAASHKWIHERLGATVPYLLELAPKVAGEQAVRLHLPMFDAWEEGILRDEQKTAFVSRSVRAGWRVDQSYWPGGSRIAVLEVAGLANMTPDTGYPSSKPWNFLKATWVAELDGKAVARGQTWAADATYVTLPEGLTPGKHKLKAAVELAELEGRWRFSVAADAEITVLDRGPQTAPAPAARPLAKIAGRVVDDKGKPAAKVLITAKSSAMGQNLREAFTAKTHSDEQGRFELSVPFGDIIYQVVAGSYGAYHLSDSTQVLPSTDKAVELTLLPVTDLRTVRGMVVGDDGKPAGNLAVMLIGEYDRILRATTDPNGRFQVTASGYMGQTVAIVRDGDLAAPMRVLRTENDKPFDLKLEPAATLDGVVRGADDQTSIAGATVLIRPWSSNSFKMEATTGKDGRYALSGIPAGEYVVRVSSAPGHFHWANNRWEFPRMTLAAGESKETNIELKHLAFLRGRVVDDANKPVAGAMVAAPMLAVNDYRVQYDYATTDRDGGFVIATAQVAESCPLAAFRSDKGLATICTRPLQPGQIADGLLLRLRGAMRVKGTVTNLQGKPIKDVVCSTEDNCSASRATGSDGKFDLGRIALSTYGTVFMRFRPPRPNWGPWTRYEVTDLETAPPFYLHRQLALKPQTVAQGDVTITLKPTSLQKIFGRVVGGGGKPVAGVDVYLLTGDANEGNWATTVRPRFDGPGSIEIVGSRPTVICGTRSGPDGRWTCWTVREDGAGSPMGGRRTDWTRYCVGILGSGSRNLLVRNIVVPEAYNTVELLIDLEAGKSRTVTTRPAIAPAATQPDAPANPGQAASAVPAGSPATGSAPSARSGQTPNGASTQPGETDRETVERLVGNLGSRSRLVRESAQKRLVEIGLPAVRLLRAAAGSDDAEVRSRAATVLLGIARAREVCVQELGKIPQPVKDTRCEPYVSPDGEHVAYVLRPGGKEILVYDGNQGPAWDSIEYVGPFSRDSKRFPYRAIRDGNSFIVFAGEEDKAIATVGTGLAVYSADCGRIAYWAKEGQEWMVCDGKACPRYKRTYGGLFSPDGKRFAYVARDDNDAVFVILDGRALKAYERIGLVTFSPDGKRLAFTARREGKEMVVCDGKEGLRYPNVFYPIFSPDGNSLAYWARSADHKQWFVIWDDKEIAQPAGEPRLTFSPDGRALACSTWSGGQLYRFAKDVQILATGHDRASQPVFSPDGRHIACALGKDLRWWVCVDGKSLPGKYDPENVMCWDGPAGGGTSMTLDSPGFSADGRHVYWKGFRGRPGNLPPGNCEHFIVCDGFEGPSHEGLWIPEDFRNHAKSLRYVVRDGDRVRLMETAWPETMTWQDAVE